VDCTAGKFESNNVCEDCPEGNLMYGGVGFF
jgi:hypothetical protein